jgi:hypothetical protein
MTDIKSDLIAVLKGPLFKRLIFSPEKADLSPATQLSAISQTKQKDEGRQQHGLVKILRLRSGFCLAAQPPLQAKTRLAGDPGSDAAKTAQDVLFPASFHADFY